MTAGQRVVLGRVSRPHGLQGEVVLRGVSLSADELAAIANLRLVGPAARWERHTRITSARPFQGGLLVRFAGVETIEGANELRSATLETEREALPSPGADEIYLYELVGLSVIEENGGVIGTVREVLATGAHEVLDVEVAELEGGSRSLLIPYHPEFVLGWDREAKQLRVRVPPGLREVYDS